jgi:hypothetical protein
MYCMQISSTFYPSSSETNRMYTAFQKRSEYMLAMVLQVKEYSDDLQTTDINLQVQIIILMLYIASVRSNQ